MAETSSTSSDRANAKNVVPLIQAVAALIERRTQRFLSERYGLTLPQYQMLLAVAAHDRPTLKSLADALECSPGNLTGLADRLERDGYITRERCREDRRLVHIHLTTRGTGVHAIRTALEQELQTLTPLCPESVWQDLARALEQMRSEIMAVEAV